MKTYRIFIIVRGNGKIYWNNISQQWFTHSEHATPFMKEEKEEREFLPLGAKWEEIK